MLANANILRNQLNLDEGERYRKMLANANMGQINEIAMEWWKISKNIGFRQYRKGSTLYLCSGR